jgi:hypothetical protein
MKNKRTILTVGIILVLACTGCAQQYDSPDDFETREVVVNGMRGIMITNYKGTKTEVRIPPRINNLPVLVIGGDTDEFREKVQANDGNYPENWAFRDKQLASVIIPNSVTTIGHEAFSENQLASVTIPNSVTTIGPWAFFENQLTSVTIPNSVITIGDRAFQDNQLTSVTIPNSVAVIGPGVFVGNRLASVTIPNNVTVIGDSAFSGNQLTSVIIPNRVTTIGLGAFSGNQLTSVIIPNSVTTIGLGAFSGNQLTSVTIPNSVTAIGGKAFQNNQLASVTLLSGVDTAFGYRVFFDNPVKSITYLLEGLSIDSIGDSCFNNVPDKLGVIIDKDNLAGPRLREFFIPGLEDCYIANGRKAGTYTYDFNTDLWSKTE